MPRESLRSLKHVSGMSNAGIYMKFSSDLALEHIKPMSILIIQRDTVSPSIESIDDI
jgi:hypothetical protein